MNYIKRSGLFLPESCRPVNKGYSEAGASWEKRALKGFTAQSGSPQEDIDYNNSTLRQRSRMLYMAAPVAASAIKTNRTNVIGVGLKLKSRIDRRILGMSVEEASAWQKKAEQEFSLWAENKLACDSLGVNDFYSLQQLAFLSWFKSGDCFALYKQKNPTKMTPYSLRIHLIEADRVSTPSEMGAFYRLTDGVAKNGNKIYDGVEVDSDGMAVAYYIRNTYPGQVNREKPIWQRVEIWGKQTGLPNIAQVMNSERPDQYRGVSYLAPVIEPLLQLRRYTESELTAAVIQNMFTGFVKLESNPSSNPFDDGQGDEDYRGTNDFQMGPGNINFLKKGESIEFAKPEHPSTSFGEFSQEICRQIGASLELPSDLLLKSFNASYSASRAALLEAWKVFKMDREWFTKDFCYPTYEVWMAESVARGRLYAPGFFDDPVIRQAYLGSEWIGPSQGQLDPVKEITAEILACSECFSTHEQSAIRLNGSQWESNVEQASREAKELNKFYLEESKHQKIRKENGVYNNLIKSVVMDEIKEGGLNDETGHKKVLEHGKYGR